MTDLMRFDDFVEPLTLEVQVLNIGGFLPARQFLTDDHAVTFFFSDAGTLERVSVILREPIFDDSAP